ncbi:MAG TPA: amidase [Steroidobacteraceae bacterium]|jgi:aspartyl-tRNA(Asn)/glutamyl-tRNA(Gln) amidotransferase subunit A|nr:amidase [Steroidobacteraceae bacterium]
MNRREVLLAAAAAAAGAIHTSLASARKASADLAELTLAEASQKIRSGAVTSRDLVLASLQRTEVENPRINAFITVMREQALADAATLDAEAGQKKFRSPLHGIPISLKDAIDTAGARTTAASEQYENRVPTQDAHVVKRLRQAGAVIFAKANLAEFSVSPTGASSYFGPVRNPWALERVTGGSSSGSAAAVATRMCFAALGTDSGGSVRLPASWCSLVGLKPTDGLVSNTGIIPSVATLDTCGPIARTVEDVAMMFGPMVGYDPLDVKSVASPTQDYVELARQPVKQLRVGVPRKGFFDEVDPQIARAVEDALKVIAKLTSGIKDVTLPPETAAHDPMINVAEVVAYHQKLLEHPEKYTVGTRNVLQWCARYIEDAAQGSTSAKMVRYVEGLTAIQRLRRTIDGAFADFDVLALPTLKAFPPTIDAAVRAESSPDIEDRPLFSIENTLTFNRLGLPALTLPCGFSAEGLPIGLMLCGPRYSEGRLLALGAAYERATEWHKRRPPKS